MEREEVTALLLYYSVKEKTEIPFAYGYPMLTMQCTIVLCSAALLEVPSITADTKQIFLSACLKLVIQVELKNPRAIYEELKMNTVF